MTTREPEWKIFLPKIWKENKKRLHKKKKLKIIERNEGINKDWDGNQTWIDFSVGRLPKCVRLRKFNTFQQDEKVREQVLLTTNSKPTVVKRPGLSRPNQLTNKVLESLNTSFPFSYDSFWNIDHRGHSGTETTYWVYLIKSLNNSNTKSCCHSDVSLENFHGINAICSNMFFASKWKHKTDHITALQ